MKYQRIFIIEIILDSNAINPYGIKYYIKKIYLNTLGYYYIKTRNLKKAQQWKYKKSCENCVEKLSQRLDPTKIYLKTNTYKITEITDNKTLRYIKLKKVQKHENQRG